MNSNYKPGLKPKFVKGGKGNKVRGASVKAKRKKTYKDFKFEPKLSNMCIVLYKICDKFSVTYYQDCVDEIRNNTVSIITNYGYKNGSRILKDYKTYTVDLMEGRNPPNPESLWSKTSSKYGTLSKYPLLGNIVREYIQGGRQDSSLYRAATVLLSSTRLMKGLVPMNLDSIIDKKVVLPSELLTDFERFVTQEINQMEAKMGIDLRYKQQPYSNLPKLNYEKRQESKLKLLLDDFSINAGSNGPNRIPKIKSAGVEAYALTQDKKLWMPFQKLASGLGFGYFVDFVLSTAEKNEIKYRKAPETRLRYITSVPDSDFKTRVIAISDYWTQMLLNPFREHILFITELMFSENVFTNDHNAGFNAMNDQIQALSGSERLCHLKFYDFSNWTDRLHHDLQKVVTKVLFGGYVSQAHAQLVIHCPWSVSSDSKLKVKYAQGQGMGTTGSFDLATLTQNFIIRYINSLREVPCDNLYGVVGDDLWIYDPDGAFEEFCKKINLPINYSKSKEFVGKGYPFYGEFVSRISVDGVDQSRVSPGVINQSTDWRKIPALLQVCERVNIDLTPDDFTDLLSKRVLTGTHSGRSYQEMLTNLFEFSFAANELYPLGISSEYLFRNSWVTNEMEGFKVRQLTMAINFKDIAVNNCKMTDKMKTYFELLPGEVRRKATSSFGSIFDKESELSRTIEESLTGGLDAIVAQNVLLYLRFQYLLDVELARAHDLEGTSFEDFYTFANVFRKISQVCDVSRLQSLPVTEPKRINNSVYRLLDYMKYIDYRPSENPNQFGKVVLTVNPEEYAMLKESFDSEYFTISMAAMFPTLLREEG